MRRRKDSIGRTPNEVDDLLGVISMMDNNKTIDQLPLFVSSDPDKMPSIKLTDGDLAVVMIKLSKLEEKINETKDTVRVDIAELKSDNIKHAQMMTKPLPFYCLGVNKTSNGVTGQQVNKTTVSSVPAVDTLRSVGQVNMTSDGTETDDNEGFISQNRKKRRKVLSPSAPTPSTSYSAVISSRPPLHQP